MAYLMENTNDLSVASQRAPFGPGFDTETIAKASRMETWGSDFNEREDYTLFILFDANNREISRRRLAGY